jgi:primosomal protein N'
LRQGRSRRARRSFNLEVVLGSNTPTLAALAQASRNVAMEFRWAQNDEKRELFSDGLIWPHCVIN